MMTPDQIKNLQAAMQAGDIVKLSGLLGFKDIDAEPKVFMRLGELERDNADLKHLKNQAKWYPPEHPPVVFRDVLGLFESETAEWQAVVSYNSYSMRWSECHGLIKAWRELPEPPSSDEDLSRQEAR